MTTKPMLCNHGTFAGSEDFTDVSSIIIHPVIYGIIYKHLHSLRIFGDEVPVYMPTISIFIEIPSLERLPAKISTWL